jgi:hypothetical protein
VLLCFLHRKAPLRRLHAAAAAAAECLRCHQAAAQETSTLSIHLPVLHRLAAQACFIHRARAQAAPIVRVRLSPLLPAAPVARRPAVTQARSRRPLLLRRAHQAHLVLRVKPPRAPWIRQAPAQAHRPLHSQMDHPAPPCCPAPLHQTITWIAIHLATCAWIRATTHVQWHVLLACTASMAWLTRARRPSPVCRKQRAAVSVRRDSHPLLDRRHVTNARMRAIQLCRVQKALCAATTPSTRVRPITSAPTHR